jgi:hypothetical protein
LASEKNKVGLGSWDETESSVRAYLHAVGDTNRIYEECRLVPPLALAAHALGALLEKLALPPGAVHSLQEVEPVNSVPWGTRVQASAMLDPPRRRGQMSFITASFTVTDSSGNDLIVGKTTVLVTGNDSLPRHPGPLDGCKKAWAVPYQPSLKP